MGEIGRGRVTERGRVKYVGKYIGKTRKRGGGYRERMYDY